MYRNTVKIEGMLCGMCEAHVCAAIRRAFPEAKKVKASRKRGEASFLTENAVDEERLKASITEIGYTAVSITAET